MFPQGMSLDRTEYRLQMNVYGTEFVKKQYVVHYLEDAPNLYGVQTEFSGIPNFMVWNVDQTWVKGNMEIDEIIGILGRYVGNMLEEEQALFIPVLTQLARLYEIHHISEYPDGFMIHTTVEGKAKCLLVSVMNMIDFDRDLPSKQHWWQRGSLN